jgi:hypothetical protein
VSQLEANKETYIAELQANLPSPGVSEEEAIALYDNYRSDIVMDLVPSLLDSMEEPVRKAVQDYLVEMKFIPPVPRIPTTKISIQVDEPVVVEEVAPVVAPAPQALVVKAVEQAPASMVVEEVAPVLAPAPQAPVVKAVEQVSAPLRKEGAEPILVPTFEEKETVVFMEPEVYESQRQDIRTKAIQDVLDRIAPR